MSLGTLTHHATIRMAQRGFSNCDLDLVRLLGAEVEGGFIVRAKDCQTFESEIRQLLARVRRLVGARVVVADNHIVTAYHATPANERRLLRGSKDRNLAAGRPPRKPTNTRAAIAAQGDLS
jgi:hypothetical protein